MLYNWIYTYIYTGWWFGTFFIFPYIGKNNPNWLIFFRGVETTNNLHCLNTNDKKGGLSLATNEWWDGDRTNLFGWCFHGFKQIQAFNLKNLGWSTLTVYLPNGFSATQQEGATIIRDTRIIDVLKFNWWMNNMKRGGQSGAVLILVSQKREVNTIIECWYDMVSLYCPRRTSK